jgi:hypothetical protein
MSAIGQYACRNCITIRYRVIAPTQRWGVISAQLLVRNLTHPKSFHP